jgi:hypothetical protein
MARATTTSMRVNPVVVPMPLLETNRLFLIPRAAIFRQSLYPFNYGVNPVVDIDALLRKFEKILALPTAVIFVQP